MPLLLAGAKVGAPLVGKLISGGARPLQNVDKVAIDAMYARRDWQALYNVMYDHQAGNPSPTAMWWRDKAREYASQKFRALQAAGVPIDQSRLFQRELERISNAEGAVESGAARVVSQNPGPDYRAPIPTAPPSTAEGIVAAVQAAAERGDAAAQAELNTRLSLGAGQAALTAQVREQQASILGPLAGGNVGLIIGAVLVLGLLVAFTSSKSSQ